MKAKTKPPSPLQGQYAGFISRFMAYMVDLLVIIGTITIVGGTFSLLSQFFNVGTIVDRIMRSQNIVGEILRSLAIIGSIAIISFSYFVLNWTFTAGQSVGKVLIGIRIVPLNGTRITLWRSIVRYFAFLFSALILFIGLLWVLISDKRQGWHDKIARTCVIYDWPAREDEGTVKSLQTRWVHLKGTRKRLNQKREVRKQPDASVSDEGEAQMESQST